MSDSDQEDDFDIDLIDSGLEVDVDTKGRTESVIKIDKFCQYLIAQKSFSVLLYEDNGRLVAHGNGFDPEFEYSYVNFEELKGLKEHFDRILVRTDGFSFMVYCIKNCIDNDNKVEINLSALREVGKTCTQYTGTLYKTKMPVWFYVIEATDELHDSTAGVEHLRKLKCLPGKARVSVRAFQINFRTNEVWTNAIFSKVNFSRIYFQKVLKAIANNQQVKPAQETNVTLQASIPVLTYILMAIFAGIFAAELYLSDSYLSPNHETLFALGGASRYSVVNDHEWYRLISYAFLHGGYVHLLLNGIAFYISGLLIETMLGRYWLLSIFILGSLGGGLASIFLHATENLTVGASGGIMGLIAASFMISFRLPYGLARTQIQMQSMYMFIPAIIPVFAIHHGDKIDYAAHLGGSIIGLMLAFFIFKFWANDAPGPVSMKTAKILAVLCGVLTIAAVSEATMKQPYYQHLFNVDAQLIPQAKLEEFIKSRNNKVEITNHYAQLLDDYPNDPRSYYLAALEDIKNKDYATAVHLLYSALDKWQNVKVLFTNREVEKRIRILLAESLVEQSEFDKAETVINPVCGIIDPNDYLALFDGWIKEACPVKK